MSVLNDNNQDNTFWLKCYLSELKYFPCEFALLKLIEAWHFDKQYCDSSNNQFAKFFNTPVSTIRRWKKNLEKNGYIKCYVGGGKNTTKIILTNKIDHAQK